MNARVSHAVKMSLAVASVAACAAALPAASRADEAPPVGAKLEEITVTAQRRAENVQDVPVAVTAFMPEEIAARQIQNTRDIGQNVPGVFTRSNTGSAQAGSYFIRGIGQGNQISTLEPGIGLYIDDVYIARTVFAQRQLLDLERIEVLRGPQGTLYGRNATGGAIKLYSATPGQERETRLEGSYGNYDRFGIRALHNQPLTEASALRVSLSYEGQEEGFQDNPALGRDVNQTDSFGARVSLGLQPSESLSWVLRADFTEMDGDTTYGTILSDDPEFLPDGTLVANGSFDEDELKRADGNIPLGNDVTDWGVSSHLEWRPGAVTLKSITGYRDNDNDILIDFNASGLIVGVAGTFRQFSQEFQLESNDGGPISWIAGLYYFYEDNDSENSLEVPGVLRLANRVQNDTSALAAFGQATWSITDRLRLGAGLRYTREEKELDISQTFNGIPTFDTSDVVALGTPVDRSFDNVSPSVVAEFDFTPDVMGYVSYTEGFKSGGWSTLLTDASTTLAFDEETVQAIELGLKSELLDRRLRLNVSAFFNEYDDLQLEDVDGNGNFFATNVGNAEIRGVEVEFTAVVSEMLEVFGHYSFLDTEVTEGGAPGSGLDRGNELSNSPEGQWQLGFSLRPRLTQTGSWLVRGSWSHRDEYFNDAQNNPLQLMDATDLVDALVRFDSDAGWYAQAGCRNCTDELYVVGRFSAAPGFPAFAGPRRTYELTVGVEF